MTDRDKIINGLKCCSKGDCADCDNCTYHGVQTDVPCESTLMRDALAMLKAQEPRVVKISELTSGEPMLVWLEDIDKDETVAGMIFDYVPGRFGFKLTNIGGMDRIYPLIEEYLTRWRCWTSRPDRAIREATPWGRLN